MKTIVWIIVLGFIAYFLYNRFMSGSAPGTSASSEIKDPYYADIRMEMPIGSRQIEFAVFGKMTSESDCRNRADDAWKRLIDKCPQCTQSKAVCSATLPQRYMRLFDNESINATYLSLTRGDTSERDGRIVIWGVTVEEGNAVCDQARSEFKKKYRGQIECIAGHRTE